MISHNPAIDKPTFLIIPGAWHSPTVYGDVCKILSTKGYDHEYVLLDTIGADPPLENFWPDVNSVRAAIDDLLSEGRDIVIVIHSCGSIAVAEALQKYIDENGNFKPGKNGAKVIRLAYLASFPIQEGQCLYDIRKKDSLPQWKVEVSSESLKFSLLFAAIVGVPANKRSRTIMWKSSIRKKYYTTICQPKSRRNTLSP